MKLTRSVQNAIDDALLQPVDGRRGELTDPCAAAVFAVRRASGVEHGLASGVRSRDHGLARQTL